MLALFAINALKEIAKTVKIFFMLNPHRKVINFMAANVRKNCRETVKIDHAFLKKCRDNKDILATSPIIQKS